MDASLLQELVWIKWALVAIAVAFVVLAASAIAALWALARMPAAIMRRASFADEAKRLLDKDQLDELTELCDRQTTEFPGDANAYWFQAQADYRKGKLRRALSSLHRVHELQPDWDAASAEAHARLRCQQRFPSQARTRHFRRILSLPQRMVSPSIALQISWPLTKLGNTKHPNSDTAIIKNQITSSLSIFPNFISSLPPDPMIAAIEQRLVSEGDKPDLKIVTTPPDPDAPPPGGGPRKH